MFHQKHMFLWQQEKGLHQVFTTSYSFKRYILSQALPVTKRQTPVFLVRRKLNGYIDIAMFDGLVFETGCTSLRSNYNITRVEMSNYIT